MGHRVAIRGSDVAAAVAGKADVSFVEAVATLLKVPPSAAALQIYANRKPDRWAQTLLLLSIAAGRCSSTLP